jgi:3-phytase
MMRITTLRVTLGAWLCTLAAALPAAGQVLPAALSQTAEVAPLPGGHWLALDARGLALIDAGGTRQAHWPVRGKHLDSRGPAPGAAAVAVLLDADTQRTLRVAVATQGSELRWQVQPVIDSPAFAVETLCMHRDAQGQDHVFLVGSEGLAEQWVLHERGAALVRRLALPPHTAACRADDAAGLLYVLEEDGGVWAYRADAEGAPARWPVALPRPLGPLRGEATALAVLPGGVAVADRGGRRLLLLRRAADGEWKTVHREGLERAGPLQSLAVRPAPPGAGPRRVELLWRGKPPGPWHARSFAWAPAAAPPPQLPVVLPRVQTEPVARFGDAADDPALWVHPGDPAQSRVLATNKKQGLLVYDLDGRQRQLLETGRLNNVDVRQQVRLGERRLDVAVATQRDEGAVVVFTIDAGGVVHEQLRVPTGLPDIYGVCLYQPRSGGLQIFVNDKDGRFLRYRLDEAAQPPQAVPPAQPPLQAVLVQRFSLASQPEACVADDARARLFIGEEKRGVWTLLLEADMQAAPALQLALPLGPLLHADVEGLALYHGRGGSYLVVSSQGNDSYVVADAEPPFRVRGAFRIGMNLAGGIDAASETDGLEATAAALGPRFPRGLLVVQDGYKRLPDGPQNFKLVDWDDVARVLGLP